MFQNVQVEVQVEDAECMQNVPKCSRVHAICNMLYRADQTINSSLWNFCKSPFQAWVMVIWKWMLKISENLLTGILFEQLPQAQIRSKFKNFCAHYQANDQTVVLSIERVILFMMFKINCLCCPQKQTRLESKLIHIADKIQFNSAQRPIGRGAELNWILSAVWINLLSRRVCFRGQQRQFILNIMNKMQKI